MITGRRKAGIIGANKYRNGISVLPGAANDAQEIYEMLKDPNIANFEIEKDHFLIGENATCQKIRKCISDLFWKDDCYDLILFYFSGHGFADSLGNGYIAPFDMEPQAPFVCGINMEELKQMVARSVNKQSIVMILDCCYSGIATSNDKPIPDTNDAAKKFESHLDSISGEGRIILASSRSDETSKEIEYDHRGSTQRHPHGAYTSCLLEALDGKMDLSESGIISLEELNKYAENAMQKLGKSQPRHFVSGGYKLSEIKIAVTYSKYIEYVKKQLIKYESLFNKSPTFSNVNHIACALHEIGVDSWNKVSDQDSINIRQGAIGLKKKIDNHLQKYKGQIYRYLQENSEELRPQIEVFDQTLYHELFGLEDYLGYDKLIITLKGKKYVDLLEVFIDAIDFREYYPIPRVMNRIKAIFQTESGRIGARSLERPLVSPDAVVSDALKTQQPLRPDLVVPRDDDLGPPRSSKRLNDSAYIQ
jgi:hypothetical protein